METIICSALRTDHRAYYRGLRHADCYEAKAKAGDKDGCAEGFVTSANRFVTRCEAATIAYAAGQITDPSIKTLYSEDVWPE